MWPPSYYHGLFNICCTSIIPFKSIEFSSIHIRVWLKPIICRNLHTFNQRPQQPVRQRGGHEICVNSCGAISQFLSLRTAKFTHRQTQPRPPPRQPQAPTHRDTPSSPIDNNSHTVSTIKLIKSLYIFPRDQLGQCLCKSSFSLFCFPNFSLSYRLSRLRILAPCILGLKELKQHTSGCVIG